MEKVLMLLLTRRSVNKTSGKSIQINIIRRSRFECNEEPVERSSTMQYTYNTHFGKQETRNVIINQISLRNVDPREEYLALEKGFALDIVNGKEEWYMSRNTRVKLSETNYNKLDWKLGLAWHSNIKEMPSMFQKILTKYIHHNNYKNIHSANVDHKRFRYCLYYHKGSIVAITKILHYNPPFPFADHDILETNFFIWNYHQPELHLGTLTLEHEIAWAKDLGLSYLYTGPGYEQSSIYKSKFDGFQWFNGMEWSTDVEEYTLLCQRDSKIRSFKAYTEI